MRRFLLPAAALLPMLAGGCAAKTAFDVVTFPVKATRKAIDWTTTSQSEADRNAGRKARKERERAYKDCRKHGGPDCAQYKGDGRS